MNLKGVKKATWARMIALLVILVNLVSFSVFHHQLIPFSDDQVYAGVSTALTVVVGFWTAWKNNSFTRHAQNADAQMNRLKGVK